MGDFHRDLRALLNRYSKEAKSDTPDYILATYITDSLRAFEHAVKSRDVWYGYNAERPTRQTLLAEPEVD